MRSERLRNFATAIATLALLFSCTYVVWAQEVKRVPVQQTPRDSGVAMFKSYCASCHGMDGKGNGPAAAAMKMPPTNLTLLAKNNGGKYPELKVTQVLGMDSQLSAHGSKDMPLWGDLLKKMESGDASYTKLRIFNLTKYIESIQAK